MNEPPLPPLDLYDLDEQFASEKNRLAHITNLCKDENDLEYFVQEAGEILQVAGKLKADQRSGKHILEYIFKQIVNWKKINPEPPF